MSVLAAESSSLTDAQPECPECLAGNLHWLLTQAHYALASAVAAALGPLGLSARGYAILSAALTGAYTQKQLADLVGLDKTTMDLHVSRRASRRIAMVTSSGGSPCPNSTSLSRRASTLHRSRSRSGEVPGGVFCRSINAISAVTAGSVGSTDQPERRARSVGTATRRHR